MAKVTVNQKTCIGCESCTALCPNVFEMRNGKSQPKMKEVKGEDESCAKNAVQTCPVGAIKVV
jgi:ferredoxin